MKLNDTERAALATQYANERITHAHTFYAKHGANSFYALTPEQQEEFKLVDAQLAAKYDALYEDDNVAEVLEAIEYLSESEQKKLFAALAEKYPQPVDTCAWCKGDANKGHHCKNCGGA